MVAMNLLHSRAWFSQRCCRWPPDGFDSTRILNVPVMRAFSVCWLPLLWRFQPEHGPCRYGPISHIENQLFVPRNCNIKVAVTLCGVLPLFIFLRGFSLFFEIFLDIILFMDARGRLDYNIYFHLVEIFGWNWGESLKNVTKFYNGLHAIFFNIFLQNSQDM